MIIHLENRRRTAFVKLAFQQLCQGIRVFAVLGIMLHDLPQLAEPSVKWSEIRLIVYRRFVHVVENLLWRGSVRRVSKIE